jgi:hypothetical protein
MFKIGEQDYNDFLLDYVCGEYDGQRVGQAFYNRFMSRRDTNDIQEDNLNRLFYCEDTNEEFDLIKSYVDWDTTEGGVLECLD